MTKINFKSTFAAAITAATLVTSGIMPVSQASAAPVASLINAQIVSAEMATTAPAKIIKVSSICVFPCAPAPSPGLTNGQKVGIGIIGALAVGAAIANSRSQAVNPAPYNNHIASCQSRYKTYDIGTNSYMSNAGYRKTCFSQFMQ